MWILILRRAQQQLIEIRHFVPPFQHQAQLDQMHMAFNRQ